jgi:Flp pilus assembly protein TadG
MRRARHYGWTSGSVAIEYAIVLPVLLLFVLGIMDSSRLIWTYGTLSRAVEAAARCGSVNTATCSTSTQIQNYAVTQAWGLSVTASAFTATAVTCGVKVSGTFDFTFNFALGTYTLNVTSCYPV